MKFLLGYNIKIVIIGKIFLGGGMSKLLDSGGAPLSIPSRENPEVICLH